MADFRELPLWSNVALFVLAAAVVWLAGTRIAHAPNALADRTGIGKAFAGGRVRG